MCTYAAPGVSTISSGRSRPRLQLGLIRQSNHDTAEPPVAAGIAVLRYRLYDIDLIINRTLIYVPTMAILGGMYTASIAIFA